MEDMFRKTIFGNLTDEEYEQMKVQAQEKKEKMLKRKEKSFYHCRIPDWTGQGGMVDFWINEDGTFESEDSRIQDKEIRNGVKKFANDWV
jgi:hypothetical protein